MKRVVVGITGASGSIYGIRLLEVLRHYADVELHLVLSRSGKRTLISETDWAVADVEAMAHHRYDNADIGATIASGSFRTAGMIIAPCSIKTAAAVATCYADTLISRAADVTLKEGRPLIMLIRGRRCTWAPQDDCCAGRDGRRRAAAMPAFYNRPKGSTTS